VRQKKSLFRNSINIKIQVRLYQIHQTHTHPNPPKMSTPPPTRIALLLFPGFQLLDATGPMDALALLSLQHPLTLSILAASLDPVPTQNWQQTEAGSAFSSSIVPTHTFDSVEDRNMEFDMVLLPGGLGSRYVLYSQLPPTTPLSV
jgi:putative intracellular protease/amidase